MINSWLHAPRSLWRMAVITHILARHDVMASLSHRYTLMRIWSWLVKLHPGFRRHVKRTTQAARLRLAIEELGPTFIKFGQMLSTRLDMLPDDVGQEFKRLQDAVPPFGFDQVRETVALELGAPLETLYSSFDPQPVASASIAQVHHAVTQDGREVAVKVMRPNIDRQVEDDIRMLAMLAAMAERVMPEWRRLKPVKVVEEFAQTIRNELNFQIEAGHCAQLGRNFQNRPDRIRFPEVIGGLSGQKVFTMSWVEGVKLSELTAHPDSYNAIRGPVAETLLTAFFKQVFHDGYFHADQHPGNILVQENGTVVMVDFGITAQLTRRSRRYLADLLHGFLTRDYRKVARVHLEAGFVPPDTDLDAFEEAARQVGEPVFGQPLADISVARLLAKLFAVTEEFQMETQPQLLLLQKTLLTLEGWGASSIRRSTPGRSPSRWSRSGCRKNSAPRGACDSSAKRWRRAGRRWRRRRSWPWAHWTVWPTTVCGCGCINRRLNRCSRRSVRALRARARPPWAARCSWVGRFWRRRISPPGGMRRRLFSPPSACCAAW
ncbi:2-polyprenylphenol 6-hydroxylase [Magnetofaba australis]|uniref:2-polyprenylphenol 6-hydroxylase n=1 Tax=Magnetofaba australis TaxID=1472297 RepID=UPI000A19D042|nr:2-polyprenylphenol 6-hydroxylase [Magnetofaba australis]